MKKLLIGIIIIGLPLIVFFQYMDYRRFNPPTSYEYAIKENIDLGYHNSEMVSEYYAKAVEIGSFARLKWSNEEIDVRFPDQNSEVELNAAKYYNYLLARVMEMEALLIQSNELKAEGLNNTEIMEIESGAPPSMVRLMAKKAEFFELKIGDRGRLVWELQKKLISHGYEHELDGLFGVATENALITFQTDNQLYPSGRIDEDVFQAIFMN